MSSPETFRGSRKHVLDWTASPSFLIELAALAAPAPIEFPSQPTYMPRGYDAPQEARLESFGPRWKPDDLVWPVLRTWWLAHSEGANTPNWDIAAGCSIEDRPGLVLVEAKANWPELGVAGKVQAPKPSDRSNTNHSHIGAAISEACIGWRAVHPGVDIKHTSHYQLANRMAFTWKLATMGIPVVLIYLGFTGDDGIRDAGEPFVDDEAWQRAFRAYSSSMVPQEMFNRRLQVGISPVWLLSRSKAVIQRSPPV
jgi:hypothetical protein